MKKKRLVLIDANSIIHRAYHAYPPQLATSKGEQTNAVYGFATILLKVIEDLVPDYLACAFDVPKPTVRHKKFVDYKKHRKPYDKELVSQFPRVKQVLEAFSIPIIEVEGFEADDVIGTIESQRNVQKLEKIIVTGDQDIFQLVDSDTKVYLSGRNFRDSRLFGPKDVEKKIGLKPEQVVDYKALFGDPSDNIPGVKGIGKTGAVKLIWKHKSLEGIYKNIEKVEGRYKKKLEQGVEQAHMSRELAEIIKDVPINFDLKSCEWGEFDAQKVRELFKELEFRSLLKKLDKLREEAPMLIRVDIPKQAKVGRDTLDIIKGVKDLKKFIKGLEKAKVVAISAFCDGSSCMDVLPRIIAFCLNSDSVYSFKIDLLKKGGKYTQEGKRIRKILLSKNLLKVGYDIKSLIHGLWNLGIDLEEPFFDVEIAAFLVKYGQGSVRLSDLAFNEFGELFDNKKEFTKVDDQGVSNYIGHKVFIIWKLYEKYSERLEKVESSREWSLSKLFYDIEMPIIKTLARMEQSGILVDKKYLTKFSTKLDKEIIKEEKRAFKCVGHEFHISSPKQVSEILFSELDLPKPSKTKAGNYSTGVNVLSDLRAAHPIVDCILKYRELSKLRSTYTTSLLEAVNEQTGRIHSTFNQAVTATGRLSSTDPNLQNIPIATDLGRKVRRAFIAEAGSTFVSFDYSQQELRILAHLAKEKNLIQAFEQGEDVHALTASKVFGKDTDKVTKKERSIGKTINFGVMYGMSGHGLSSMLKISLDEANRFIEKYFEEYSSIQKFFDEYLEKAQSKGFAVTIFGRRRSARDLDSSNMFARRAAIREIINFPIQGSAADMMKLAMVKIDDLIQTDFRGVAQMLLQIHDELVFEFKGKRGIKKFTLKVKKIMEEVYELEAPLKVDVYTGKNLEEVH